MGTKGRDLVLYLFFSNFLLVVTGSLLGFPVIPFSLIILSLACMLVYYYFVYFPKAKKYSQKLGLRHVVLLPLNYKWAVWLLFLAKRRFSLQSDKAHEIHINMTDSKSSKEYYFLLDRDLQKIIETMQGLFLWETAAPIPASVRSFLRGQTMKGLCFWEKGQWPIARFPFTKLDLKKKNIRRGSILLIPKS